MSLPLIALLIGGATTSAKHTAVKIAPHYDNEVVLVDLDAFDGQGDIVYARSWSFDDGSVISAVGLKSDFEAFDLIV